jgi:hypothetical protein
LTDQNKEIFSFPAKSDPCGMETLALQGFMGSAVKRREKIK